MRLTGCVILAISLLLCLPFSKKEEICPRLHYRIHEKTLSSLPSAFAPLSEEEKQSDWGKEFRIATGFGKKLDLYRAITAFERAELLSENQERQKQMEYQILYSYYLGKQYEQADLFFSKSHLQTVSRDFPPFHDLLLILFDTYMQLGDENRAASILAHVEHHFPETYEKLLTTVSFLRVDSSCPIAPFYEKAKKSIRKAALCNAFLPGLGYFYLGQTQTALTALFMNALFIGACIYFFRKKALAAGFIFLSFAIGWYGGGIHGAMRDATLYNERVYEELATPLMNQEGYFPIHMLRYGF